MPGSTDASMTRRPDRPGTRKAPSTTAPMRHVPTSYYDWILSSDFPADVKALAAEAKLGKFPGGK